MSDEPFPTVPERALPDGARPDGTDERLYDLAGQELDGYRVICLIGKGGMGRVYKAVDTRLRRFVAIKIVAPPFFLDLDYLSRFEREMHALASLNHPNVAQIYSAGRHDGVPYYAMEHIEGRSLREVLASGGGMRGRQGLVHLIEAAEGLGAAYKQGLIHRDVKPSNLMISDQGVLKIVDFGIARRVDEDSSLTAASSILGTPRYMSPEQAMGAFVDHRSDIYSLGASFYHLFAGSPPFRGDAADLRRQHAEARLEPLRRRNPRVPIAVAAIVDKMTAKRAEERYQLYPDLSRDLRQAELGRAPAHAPTAAAGASPAGSARRIKIPPLAWMAAGFAAAILAVILIASGGDEPGDGGKATAGGGPAARSGRGVTESLPIVMTNERYDEAMTMAMATTSLANMRRISTAIEVSQAESGRLPTDLGNLADEHQLHPAALLDGWGRPIVYEPQGEPHFRVISVGPDGRRGSGDDIVLEDGFVVQGSPEPPDWMREGMGGLPQLPAAIPGQ